MNQILNIIQLVLSVLLIVAILLQQRGAGLGAGFGGSSTVFTTRRGVDKVLYQATIAISILFFATALASIFF